MWRLEITFLLLIFLHYHHHLEGLEYKCHSRFHNISPLRDMGRGISIRQICYCIIASMIVVFLLHYALLCENSSKAVMVPREKTKYVYNREQKAIPYDENMPLIFIGGMPRSGTTLLRAMLDAHPDVRCGEETRVIPRILGMRGQWEKSAVEKNRLNEAGITTDVIDSAVKAFILEIIAKHGEAADRLCNKDPFTLKSSVYLSKLFPNSKFLLLIRDGRATVHSIIQRKVTITGFNLDSFRDCMTKWNQAMETMYGQCIHVGPHTCMPVYYEQLVLHPNIWMKRILHFLDIPWNETVLHHQDYIEKPGGISLSKTERSSDQIIKPINTEALIKWVGHVPEDVKQDMGKIAPMLQALGYDPAAYPPPYGDPDPSIADNTMHVKQNVEFWRKKVDKMLQRTSNDKQHDTNIHPPER